MSVRLLETALNDPDPRVVVEAERGLGRLRVSDALAILEQMAGSGGDQAQAAIEALADIGDKRAVSTIENGLASSDKFIEIESAYALARLGEDGMIERLESMLKVDPGAERVGLVAAYYLVRLDRPAGLSHLDALLKGEDRTYAVLAADFLGKSSNPKAVPLLAQGAGSDEPGLRIAIARSLGLLGGQRAVLELKKLRADTNESVRAAALSALAELGELE
jgi:HEAT repeat protein